MKFPVRLLTCQARVSISFTLLIWFQSENLNTGERDQEVDISDMEGSGLADVQNGETSRQERTEN